MSTIRPASIVTSTGASTNFLNGVMMMSPASITTLPVDAVVRARPLNRKPDGQWSQRPGWSVKPYSVMTG